MGIKHTTIATGTDDPAKQISVNKWNEAHSVDTSLDLPIATPATPADGLLSIYANKVGGRSMLMQKDPTGKATDMQAGMSCKKIAFWNPVGGATTAPGIFGMAALTISGNPTSRPVDATNFVTRMHRTGFMTGATSGQITGIRNTTAQYTIGAGGGMGGFFFRCRFVPSDAATVAGARMFVGLSASTGTPTGVDPSTMVNCIGLAQLSTSNNLHIVYGGSSAQTPIDLGSTFTGSSLSTAAYDVVFYSPSSTAIVYYQVTKLPTGETVSGTLTTGLPATVQLLTIQIFRGNNATALAVGIDVASLYIETDY